MRTRFLGRTAAVALLVSVGFLSMAPDHGPVAPSPNGGADLIAGTTNVAYLGPTLDLPGALGNAEGSVGTVWRFDAFAAPGSTPWQLWSAALPASLQGFTQLLYGGAYFAVSSEALRWEFAAGEVPDPPLSVQLGANGNNVVYFGDTLPVETVIADVVDGEASGAAVGVSQAGSITSIWSLGAGVWSLWSETLPATLQGISELVFGRPYFVTASAALEWVFPQPAVGEPPPRPDPLAAERTAIVAALREIAGPLLSEAEIAAVAAGMRDHGTQTFFDRLPALEDPSLEIALAGVFEFDLEASAIAAVLGGLMTSQVVVPEPPPGEVLEAYVAGFLWLGGAPNPADGIDSQLGMGVSLLNGPNTTPDPLGIGAGHLGLNLFGFIDGVPGWVRLIMLSAVNGFTPLATHGFGYVGQSRLAMFFLPVGEVPAVSILHFVVFGRETDGQPPTDVQPARTEVVTIVERPGDSPWADPLIDPPQESTPVLLNNGRFQVEVTFEDFDGTTRPAAGGLVEGLGDGVFAGDTALFFFSDPDNWELLVKVLDGCPFNGHYWVFAAATTNVEFTVTVTDTQTNQVREYDSDLATPFEPIVDTSAFFTCDAVPSDDEEE